jgi:hypothetical protein
VTKEFVVRDKAPVQIIDVAKSSSIITESLFIEQNRIPDGWCGAILESKRG